MSHTTSIDEIVFSDIAALKMAVNDLKAMGLKVSLIENATPRAYYSDQKGMGKAPYVLRLEDGSYDVGFYADKEKKGLVARTDFYDNHISKFLGGGIPRKGEKVSDGQRQMGKLFAAYAVNAATLQAQRQGYSVRRVPQKDGGVQLIMTGMRG